MISNVLRWLFLLVSGLVLVVGLSPSMQRWLDQHGYIPNQYIYGDLYNLTNLPGFKEDDFMANDKLAEADKPARHYHDVDLYTIGDSFTDIDTSFYAGNRNAHIWVGFKPPTLVTLDSTKKNILVIQFIERVLQERLYWPDYQRMYMDAGYALKNPPTAAVTQVKKNPNPVPAPSAPRWLSARFAEQINQRLEFLLFNGWLATRFKEAKAQLMLTLFGRVTGGFISKDRQHLFYQAEVDTAYVLSAFRKIPDQKLDTVVNNLNTMRQHYLRMGFDEVYLCMVPNKVTVLEPTYGRYNHQIERIEAHPWLQMPFISTIDSLRQHPDWYHLGDGHWNNQGKRFWLRQVNQLVAQWSREPEGR
ncbi:MAG: hypothetical protein JWP57_557 [Spirosoma sp.]|nr:hypothetical protein [Spirosoma sp.]